MASTSVSLVYRKTLVSDWKSVKFASWLVKWELIMYFRSGRSELATSERTSLGVSGRSASFRRLKWCLWLRWRMVSLVSAGRGEAKGQRLSYVLNFSSRS